jgi:myo-inositol-1(or 4)-monophosphatase
VERHKINILKEIAVGEIVSIADIAKQAAVRGGKALMDYFQQKQRVWLKSPFEMVTEADLSSEQTIISDIKNYYPDHMILTEEQGQIAGNSNHVWIIDPLDGTFKFVMGEPYFSVSIAYELNGIVEIGVVYNPYTEDIYFACRGKGASKNGIHLEMPAVDNLAGSLVCCDWGGSLAMQEQGLCYLSKLLPPATRGVGVNFSPALDLCNVAEGRISAMISNGTTTEDHSAASLVVSEAGGIVTNYRQTTWSHRNRGIVATNSSAIIQEVRLKIQDCQL